MEREVALGRLAILEVTDAVLPRREISIFRKNRKQPRTVIAFFAARGGVRSRSRRAQRVASTIETAINVLAATPATPRAPAVSMKNRDVVAHVASLGPAQPAPSRP
jgi:ornithine cyclodeaminase/alanine dehydrogenase-like protein (mu-crystallin family)